MSLTTIIDKKNELLWHSRFLDSQTMPAEARVLLKKAKDAKYMRGIAQANLNIAAVNFYRSDNKTALIYLNRALRWFEKNKQDKCYVRALLINGNIFESFGNYERTLKIWLEALKISKEINDPESEAEASSQLGLIYLRLNNFQKSFEYFEKGLKLRQESNDENGVASSLNRIGMVLRNMKKLEESLDHYFQSLEIRRRNRQFQAIPWTLLGIANTYEEMKKYPESLGYYEQGMQSSDNRCMLQCCLGTGRIYSKLGDSSKAEEWLKKSLLMAKELKSLALIAEAYMALSSHFELSGELKKAINNFKLFYKTKESFQSAEIQSRLSNLEVAHAIEKSEQEKEIYRLRNIELKQANEIIEAYNKEITASINYASRIQKAMLPAPEEIDELTNKYFILYIPKEIVSGDFYWFSKLGRKLIAVAGDCTGHGVPGALMSMLGISFLEEIVNYRSITESGKILDELRKEIQKSLRQKGSKQEAKDGIDISLCVIDMPENKIQFSGAYNNLYLIRNGEISEYQADRMPIAIFDITNVPFRTNDIETAPGDLLYLYTDGYADQVGGPKSKKYKYSSLKTFLLSIHKMPMQMQEQKLEEEFLSWKGSNPQRDDVLIMGLRI